VKEIKPENLKKNPRSKVRTTITIHIWLWVGIEPEPHWEEVSALTTASSLLAASPLLTPFP